MVRGSSAKPLSERLWAKVDRTGGPDACWPFVGSIASNGYGSFHLPGIGSTTASRASWIINVGPIPEGMEVCHRCDNRPCVNPAHLFLGTPTVNRRDMVDKGRWNGPRIAPEVVAAILEGVAAGERQRDIAGRLGVDQSTVSRIARR